MLFIGRTMNKETQLGRKEKGRREEKKNRAIHRVAHITCGISRSSQHRFPAYVCGSEHFPTGCALASTSSLAEKGKVPPEAVMCWYRCCGCARFGAPPLLKAGVTGQYSYSGI